MIRLPYEVTFQRTHFLVPISIKKTFVKLWSACAVAYCDMHTKKEVDLVTWKYLLDTWLSEKSKLPSSKYITIHDLK